METSSNNNAKQLQWLMFKQESEKFPYLLFIEEKPNEYLQLQVQDKWPGPGRRIFSLPEGYCGIDQLPSAKPIEQCGIISIERYGKRLTIVLDRKIRRRCWFLFLKKEYKKKPGEFYDQVFWVTQSSAVSRRAGAYIPQGRKKEPLLIVSDKRERYGYKFPKTEVVKENLPVGDYGLKINGELV
ncbi:TPA: hypothetical protein DCX16_00100, partial [bacterium]|nr:hypothetical protein [bacterium]